jgi:hypothetical protein
MNRQGKDILPIGRQVPRNPRPVGGVKGHKKNEISFPGSPGLSPGSFTINVAVLGTDTGLWLGTIEGATDF